MIKSTNISEEKILISKALQFLHSINKDYIYHNLEHTKTVVNIAETMGNASGLSSFDLNCLTIAAWFHDVGFIKGAENHEFRGSLLVTQLLKSQKAPEAMIIKVVNAIMSTRLGVEPLSSLGELLTDADTYHLSVSNYEEYSTRLKKELELTTGEKLTTREWTYRNIHFFEHHQYHSKYAKAHFDSGKQLNLESLKEALNPNKN